MLVCSTLSAHAGPRTGVTDPAPEGSELAGASVPAPPRTLLDEAQSKSSRGAIDAALALAIRAHVREPSEKARALIQSSAQEIAQWRGAEQFLQQLAQTDALPPPVATDLSSAIAAARAANPSGAAIPRAKREWQRVADGWDALHAGDPSRAKELFRGADGVGALQYDGLGRALLALGDPVAAERAYARGRMALVAAKAAKDLRLTRLTAELNRDGAVYEVEGDDMYLARGQHVERRSLKQQDAPLVWRSRVPLREDHVVEELHIVGAYVVVQSPVRMVTLRRDTGRFVSTIMERGVLAARGDEPILLASTYRDALAHDLVEGGLVGTFTLHEGESHRTKILATDHGRAIYEAQDGVHLVRLSDFRPILELIPREGEDAPSVKLSDDGRYASLHAKQSMRVLDVLEGKVRWSLPGGTGTWFSNPSSTKVAPCVAARRGSDFSLHRRDSGKELWRAKLTGELDELIFNETGSHMALWFKDERALIVETKTGSEVWSQPANPGAIDLHMNVLVSPEGAHAVVMRTEGKGKSYGFRLLDLGTGKVLTTGPLFQAWSPRHRRLAVTQKPYAKVFEVKSFDGTVVSRISAPGAGGFASEGRHWLERRSHSEIDAYDVRSGKRVARTEMPSKEELDSSKPFSNLFSGRRVSTRHGTVLLHDFITGETRHAFPPPVRSIGHFESAPGAQHAVMASVQRGPARWLDLDAGTITSFGDEKRLVIDVAMASDGSHAAVVYHGGIVEVWAAGGSQPVRTESIDGAAVVAISPGAAMLAVGTDWGKVHLFQSPGDGAPQVLDVSKRGVSAVAVTATPQRVVALWRGHVHTWKWNGSLVGKSGFRGATRVSPCDLATSPKSDRAALSCGETFSLTLETAELTPLTSRSLDFSFDSSGGLLGGVHGEKIVELDFSGTDPIVSLLSPHDASNGARAGGGDGEAPPILIHQDKQLLWVRDGVLDIFRYEVSDSQDFRRSPCVRAEAGSPCLDWVRIAQVALTDTSWVALSADGAVEADESGKALFACQLGQVAPCELSESCTRYPLSVGLAWERDAREGVLRRALRGERVRSAWPPL